ncbi:MULTISPECIES: hypothetical protein [unclassified Streptomyces]|uniref:hypothetical protein n=1 Tax=unclassified Streptomyces TaxID=2593676 RepID=UPI0003A7E321|nr:MULTISPECIES: hypothetical protein [unclassified Streptomyces]MYY04755.1 hypothetical protein [Streptomyces sp. SID4913]
MNHFVMVEASLFPEMLRARCAYGSCTVRLSAANRVPGVPIVDEHLVVDVDTCGEGTLLDCADVLQGSRAHSPADALRRLAVLTSAHPACTLAAVPLAGATGAGGWALACGLDRSMAFVPHGPHRLYQGSAGQSLLPSCVHAWLVAGRSLRQWPYAHAALPG